MISNWSYSQTTYPRTLVIDKDTVVAITRQQAIKINLLYSRLDQCSEIQDSLLVTIDSCKVAFELYNTIVQGYNQEIELYKMAIADRDTVINLQKVIINNQKKDIRKLRIKSTIATIGSGVLAIVAVIALIL